MQRLLHFYEAEISHLNRDLSHVIHHLVTQRQRNPMFHNQILEQFVALQNQSLDSTRALRQIAANTLKNLMEANYNATKVFTSLTQENSYKFAMPTQTGFIPSVLGNSEIKEVLSYFGEYQNDINQILTKGNEDYRAALESLSLKYRTDMENVIHGLFHNAPIGCETFMPMFRTVFDAMMQGCEQSTCESQTAPSTSLV